MIHVIVNSDTYYQEFFIPKEMTTLHPSVWQTDVLANLVFLSAYSTSKEQ